ncbi:MAG: hypothetical protein ABL955_04820 [Elusimicrobiota bacterium]
MKKLKITVLAALLAAAAAPLFAAPRRCANGLPPMLSGDLFSPAECSTATKTTVTLPGSPATRSPKDAAPSLKELEGRWDGILFHALGRYELLLTVKTGWGGKTDLTLDLKEQQFHQRLTDRLALVPAKERGTYATTLTSSLIPGAELKGVAGLGSASAPERQADISLSNGAVHRINFTVKDNAELRVRAYSGIPGAPLQTFEVVLKRTKREAL